MSKQKDLSMVSTSSEFSESVLNLFSKIRPTRIIETGTYHGTGTTSIIASSLRDLAIENAVFYSIEVNPSNHAKAVENLTGSGLLVKVRLLNGLSVPRLLLPTMDQIEDQYVHHLEYPYVLVDHLPEERAQKYFSETDWPDVPEDVIGNCLKEFNFSPDFILLDSAGSMGNIEFNYVIGQLKSACYIALDDIRHVKHHKSLIQMRKDPRFRIIDYSDERTGFCIAHFDPSREKANTDPDSLLSTGEQLFAEGRTQEAVLHFEKAIKLDPSNIQALNDLGVASFHLNASDMAEEFFTKALRLNRRDEDAIRNLAALYAERGETHRAEKILAVLPGGIPSPRETSPPILSAKRILVINNLYPPQELGGYGRVIADFVNLLIGRGHHVHVLTSDTRYLGEAQAEAHVDRRLQLFGEWSGKGLVEYEREVILPVVRGNHSIISGAVEGFRPDISLVGNIDLLSALVFRPFFERNVPVLHLLGNEFIGYPVSDAPMNPLYHVAAPSRWLKEDAIRRGYPFKNAFLIYSGAFVREFEMDFPPATDRLRIAYAGLVNSYKGPQVLIQALEILNQRGIDFSCSIAGGTFDNEFVAKLKQAVTEMDLEGKVRFTGRLDREGLKDLYARHNVLVFPSLVNETFGISQVEAMAAGLLAITSGTGGAREVVEDGVSGLRFEPGDHRQLAAHLAGLVRDRSRWETIAAQGQKKASEKFDIEASADSLEKAIAEILVPDRISTIPSKERSG
jgi:glycosyltransferase involved in cell wall biosynthesis/predicted O-methyltransferase YrrM